MMIYTPTLPNKDDPQSMIETLYITPIPGMKESILNASKEPLENFSDKIDWDSL